MKTKLAAGIALVVAAAVATAAVVGARMVAPRILDDRALCAEFTDAVGLYPGNKVQLLGINVGDVTAVTNEPRHVRVDFTVSNDVDLPADVGAVTYTQSIVTDRHLELTKPYASGPKFTGAQCIGIASTKTPIGISESFTAIGKLSDAIIGPAPGADPAKSPGVQAINDSLRAAARSLDGTGDGLSKTVRNLAAMIGDPYKADADYRRLFENSELLSSGWLKHWDAFKTTIETLPATASLIEGLSGNFASALSHLVHLLPLLVDVLNRFAPRVYHNISDKAIPWIRDLLNAYTPHILGFLNSLPQFTDWLADIYEPAWGTTHVTYLPPRVSITPDQANAICANLRTHQVPGAAAACAPGAAADPVTLGLTDMILGGALS